MNLKDLFKAAHQAGNDGIDFESWFEQWADEVDKAIADISKRLQSRLTYYESTESNVLGKNIIAPGSNIVCGGNFHVGDK